MDFFKKYRQLFQVKEDALTTASRLTINHQLFIDQPYRPAYSQELKLSSKLMEMRKDTNQLEQKIDEIMNVVNHKTPTPHHQKTPKPISNRLSNIFNQQTDQIVRESEMQHIFNHRLREKQKEKKRIEEPIPKVELPKLAEDRSRKFQRLQPVRRVNQYPVTQPYAGQDELPTYKPQRQPIEKPLAISQAPQSYRQAKPSRYPYNEAMKHRKEASRKLQERRQKLRLLLKQQ